MDRKLKFGYMALGAVLFGCVVPLIAGIVVGMCERRDADVCDVSPPHDVTRRSNVILGICEYGRTAIQFGSRFLGESGVYPRTLSFEHLGCEKGSASRSPDNGQTAGIRTTITISHVARGRTTAQYFNRPSHTV